MDFYKPFDTRHFALVTTDTMYDLINTIEESMISSIIALPVRASIKYFVKRYIKNLAIKGGRYPNSLDNAMDDLSNKLEAVWKIQICWRESISNPKYKLCRSRLKREFNEMNDS